MVNTLNIPHYVKHLQIVNVASKIIFSKAPIRITNVSKSNTKVQKYAMNMSSFKYRQKQIASKDNLKQKQVTDILM